MSGQLQVPALSLLVDGRVERAPVPIWTLWIRDNYMAANGNRSTILCLTANSLATGSIILSMTTVIKSNHSNKQ